ncbi:MAG: hypothetical protein HY712_07490 [candidate division NC10 bacterium]|nr:hypothetical protein [candidate division NC10 bacterium]
MISDNCEWRIGCSGAQLDRLRTVRRFHQILALARLINALGFSQISTVHANDLVGPAGTRQRINGFFLLNALLFEGFRLAQGMAKEFRTPAAWGSGLGAILKDPRFSDLFSEHRKPARDKLTFHIDDAEIARLISEFPTDDVTLVCGRGPAVRDTYDDLSDVLAFHAVVGPVPSHAALNCRFAGLLPVARDMAIAFVEAAEGLVLAILKDMGFKSEVMGNQSKAEE